MRWGNGVERRSRTAHTVGQAARCYCKPSGYNSPAFTAFFAHAATAERRETGCQAIAAALPTALLLGRRCLLILHGRLALGRAIILTLRGTILALGRTVLALRGTVGLRGNKSA